MKKLLLLTLMLSYTIYGGGLQETQSEDKESETKETEDNAEKIKLDDVRKPEQLIENIFNKYILRSIHYS